MYPFFKLKMVDADSVGSEDVFSEMDSAIGPTYLNFDQIGQLSNAEVVAFHNEKLKHDDTRKYEKYYEVMQNRDQAAIEDRRPDLRDALNKVINP
jgi:hypothetical protein